jgi:hypothetical protein
MKFFQKPKFLIPVLLLLVLLIVGSVAGYAIGKYRSDVVLTGTVTTRTQLVGGFRLTASRSSDGSTEITDAETAYLIPGAEVDLSLTIEGKTEILSYLYVEITGKLDPSLLTEDWTLLDGVTGKHGGAVYAYAKVLDGSEADMNISILRKGMTMDANSEEPASPLSFCGYLLQITSENTRGIEEAKTTFVNKFPQS